MAVIRGPYVRLWFENCAENRKRCRTTREDARGTGENMELTSLAYYGSRYYRGTRGISRPREVGEEFSFGASMVAMPMRKREKGKKRERKRGEKSVWRNWIPRDISRAECDNLCFTFNKTKRERRRTIEPLARGSFLSGL